MSTHKNHLPEPAAMRAMAMPIPRSATALMQHLQLLVGREGYRHWCGGVLPPAKLAGLVAKFAVRYPISATARQCSYGRSRGRAAVKFVAFLRDGGVHWWLLSSNGLGGLADAGMVDAHVARDANAADSHIEFGDYVLLHATKKEPREIADGRTGRVKTVLKDTSTWTWKLRAPVMSEIRVGIRECCEQLSYGAEDSAGRRGWGLRGLLSAQRERPLFSGVRTQVIELHREGRDAWNTRRASWLMRFPGHARQFGERAGRLVPVEEVVRGLPKMRRLPVYDDVRTIASLCLHSDAQADGTPGRGHTESR
jgi:hypothetical protein